MFESSIELEKTVGPELKPTSHGTTGVVGDDKVRLSSNLDKFNNAFGDEFNETDFLSRGQVKADMLMSE